MKVQVQLVNERGRAKFTSARASSQKYTGTLRINEERVHALGRNVVMANLVSEIDGTNTPLLPPLFDAITLYARAGQIRIRGFELLDGTEYGQTWDVKVL